MYFRLCLDPRNWSETDVKKWVLTKLNNYGVSLDTVCWNAINGIGLCSYSKEELMTNLCNSTAAEIIYSELKKLKNGELQTEFKRNIKIMIVGGGFKKERK